MRQRVFSGQTLEYAERAGTRGRTIYQGPDGVSHSCGEWAVPNSAINVRPYGFSWAHFIPKSDASEALFDSVYSSLSFDLTEPRALWPDYKGMWPHFVAGEMGIRQQFGFVEPTTVAYLKRYGGWAVVEAIDSTIAQHALIDDLLAGELLELDRKIDDWIETGWWSGKSDIVSRRAIAHRETRRSYVAEMLMQRMVAAVHPCEHFDLRKCTICFEEFPPQGSFRLAFAGAPLDYCSSCVGVFEGLGHQDLLARMRNGERGLDSETVRNVFVSGVKVFFSRFGYIPTTKLQKWKLFSRELRSLNTPAERVELFKLLAVTPDDFLGKSLFGSAAEYLDAAGLFEGRIGVQGGYRSIASDRHVCLSMGERTICEYLASNGAPHSKEPFYPKDQDLNPNGKFRADFQVGNWFVEYAGRMSVVDYAERMKAKKRLAKTYGIQLLILEPKDLLDLEKKFSKVLFELEDNLADVE